MRLKAPDCLGRRSITRTVLDNGVKVWTEHVPQSSSVAVGIWVDAGSRYEDGKESGSTHLIQRTAFRGTRKRSARSIANAVAGLGGDVSVDTGRDHAVYLARIGSGDIQKALDLLADLVSAPTLEGSAIAAEQRKILEELRAAETDPDCTLEDMFLRSIWNGRGLCRPPNGRLLTFKGQTKLDTFRPISLQRLHRESHHPKAITVTLSGELQHEDALSLVAKFFGTLKNPEKTASTLPTTNARFVALRNRPQFPGVRMILGVPACGATDSSRHAAGMLNALIGGGEGSRLSQQMHGNRLPAQKAASQLLMFSDVGVLTVRLQSQPKRAAEALGKTVDTLRALATEHVNDGELEKARTAQHAELAAVLESPTARIRDMARQERYFERVLDSQCEIDEIRRVTPEQIRQLASAWVTPHTLSLAAIGDLNGVSITPAALRW